MTQANYSLDQCPMPIKILELIRMSINSDQCQSIPIKSMILVGIGHFRGSPEISQQLILKCFLFGLCF